jgi:signal recognition particle subunit SRP54
MDELNKLISEWKKMKEKMEQVGKMIQKGKNPFGSFMK